MTASQAAKVIGCTVGQVRTLIRQGTLKAKRVQSPYVPKGHYYNITPKEVERYRDKPQLCGFPRGQSRNKGE